MIADAVFERLKSAVDRACAAKDYAIATQAAQMEGLQMSDVSKGMSIRLEYRGEFGEAVIGLDFRSFDQSQAFSIRPDMNRFHLTLTSGGKQLREYANEFED